MKVILTTVVGSKAHGTDRPDSDIDTRSVYVLPSSEILSIYSWEKFKEDKDTDTNAWELQRFIWLSLKSNPNSLEALKSDPILVEPWGEELRSLFPTFLSRKHVYNAYKGFALGQRKKLLSPDTNDARKPKAASHYLRVLYNGIELLNTGTFTVKISDTDIGWIVKEVKTGEMVIDYVISFGHVLEEQIDRAYETSTLQLEPNKAIINDYLLRVRKEYW